MTGAQIGAWQSSGRPVLCNGQPVTMLRTVAVLGCDGWHTVAQVRRADGVTATVPMGALRLGGRA